MEDYFQAPRRNKASASTLSKKISKNANGSDLAPKTVYDDVFGGPPKFGVPTFSVQVEDYSEIFGRFHSLPGFSIPVLDLPVPHDCDVSIEVHASKFNYSEIFGGFNGVDFFDSYEELFGASKEGEELFGASKGESSSEEAWTPAGTRSPSEGSSGDTLACSENNQSKSDGVTHNTLDGVKQLNVPNYEDMPRSEENGTNDKTNTVPGVALGVDGSTPPYKTEIINVSSGGMNDIGGNMDNEAIFEEILFKKTTSLPPMYGSITNTFGSDYELQRRSHGNGSYSGEILVSVSEISLKTQPSQVPPPMRPPPKLFTKQGESKIASENFGLEGAAGDGSPDFFDVEVDANSSAAASAAAMKEAMEKALARLKSAKELMERKRVSGKARKEDNKGNHETLRFRGNGTQGKSETEDIVMEGFGRLEGLKDIRTTQVAPNFEGSKKGLNGGKEFVEQKVTKGPSSSHSHIDKEAGEWRVEKQFYELAKTVKSKAPLEVFEEAKNEKKLMAPIIIQKHEKSQKVAVKQVCQQLEENVEKSKASKEACVEENSRISEAAIEASELKTVEKKLTVAEDMTQAAKEASELKKVEKKLMVAEDTSQCEGSEEKLKMARETWELEEDQKKLERASEWEEDEERQREASCSGLSERRSKDAIEKEDNGKKPKDCSKREENEKLKDSCQREENEKKLKEVYELEFNGRRLPEVHEMENNNRQNDAEEQEHTNKQLLEACEQEKNDKRQQEAHDRKENEKRLKQAFKEEENERRLKEVCELKENEIRLKEVYKAEENKKQVKVIFEPVEDAQKQRESNEEGTNENRENQACEWEENKVKVNQDSLDLKVDKNFVTATGSFKPVVDNNFEGIQEDPIENSRKLKLAPEATEPEVSGGMTEAANDACECEGDEKELKIPKAGDEKDESGRSRPADMVQCAPEQDSVEGIKNSMEDLSLDGLEGKLGEFEIVDDLEPNKKDHRTSQVSKNQETAGNCQVANDRGAYQNSNEVAEGMKNCMDQGASLPSVMSVEAMGNMQKIDQEVDKSHCTEIKEKYYHKTCSNVEIGKNEKLESKEEKEHEREREKNMIAVERATREARERAERAAVDRATAEARQRAMAEAREKLEKTSAEAREKSLAEKALTEARLRSEHAAVERAIAEARERAAEKAVLDARERVEKSSESAERFAAEKFSVTNSRDSGMRQSSSFSELRDPQLQNMSCDSSSRYANSSVHDAKFLGTEGESAQRCKARLERHRRIVERAAKALVEKNMRDLIVQREQAERNRLAETLDAEVRRWSSGKEGNLRALLSTLQYILGPDSGWQPIPLTEVITAVAVKKAYKKATLSVHPDKLQQRRASIQQKYICEKVFDLLKDAWNRFNSEER